MVVEFAVASVVVTRRYPGTRLSFAGFDRAEVRSIIGFSVFVLLLTLGNKLSFRTSALVLGKFESESAVAAFSIPLGLVLNLTDFVLAIGAVVMPTAIKYRVDGREKELAAMFLQWSKVALSLALVAGLYLIVLGEDFVRVWIDKSDFDSPGAGKVLTILMLSHFVFLPIRGIGLPILMGLGKPAKPTVAFLIAGILNLGIALALVRPLGLAGVALGIAIPDVLFALYLLGLVCRELGVSAVDYARYVAGRAVIGAIPVLAILFALRRALAPQSFPPLVLAGIASTALFAVIWVFFVYRNDPYIDAAGRLRRLFAFARKRTP
jgi:O-antigen/teichoic acid export membrane protein